MNAVLIQTTLETAFPTTDQFATAVTLSDYDLAVLTELANGRLPKQMAPRRKYRSVRRALARCRDRLEARTTCHAVAIAVARGLIRVDIP